MSTAFILLLDLHQIGVTVFTTASVLSLLLVIAKPLATEFADVVLVWIDAFKRILAELRKPLTFEQPPEPHVSDQTSSKRARGSCA